MPLSCGPIPYYVATSPIQLSGAFITLNRLPGPTNAPLAVTPTKIAVSNYADCTPIAAEQARATFAVRVLPQPMRSSARILLAEGSLADDAQLHITDLSGRSLALPATRLHDGWEIQRGGLPAGIYAYQVLQDGQRIASGKLWVAD
jgi:hypothetical protein